MAVEREKLFNGSRWTVIAGPCAAETKEQILQSAGGVSKGGADIFRSGLWKPRTEAKSWQGVGEEGIEWMVEAKKETGLAIATEVRDSRTLEAVLKASFDVVWIGSRSSTHYPLLEEVGLQTKDKRLPVILKRGMGSSLRDWLGAAEYIAKHNPNVVFCERGITSLGEQATRFTLDLQTAKLAQKETGLPVIVDVSHAAGRRDLIIPMAAAAKAAGLNGLMVEVHFSPDEARTDSKQQIGIEQFRKLMDRLSTIPFEP